MRTPTPNDNCPCSSFSRAGFLTAAVIGGSSIQVGYSIARLDLFPASFEASLRERLRMTVFFNAIKEPSC